jgi:hypothetical protein
MDSFVKMTKVLGCDGVSSGILLGLLTFKIKAKRPFANSGPLSPNVAALLPRRLESSETPL